MNLILDTDISNEVDDQFALTYLMKSIDLFNLEAITIAPFGHSGYKKTKSKLNLLQPMNKVKQQNITQNLKQKARNNLTSGVSNTE